MNEMDNISNESFNKMQFLLIKDMFLHKPVDFHKYGVEKLGSNKFHIKMNNGQVRNVHFEQYQLLDLMVVILSNNNSEGIKFEQNIQKINGYELVSKDGVVELGHSNFITIPAGGKEVFILRFVDGEKEYLPDFR
jgi:hypothetical protein